MVTSFKKWMKPKCDSEKRRIRFLTSLAAIAFMIFTTVWVVGGLQIWRIEMRRGWMISGIDSEIWPLLWYGSLIFLPLVTVKLVLLPWGNGESKESVRARDN